MFLVSGAMSANKTSPNGLLEEHVKVFRSIDEIGEDEINSLAHDPCFTYGWFKTLETQKTYPISPLYLAIYNESKIVCVAPLLIERMNLNANDVFSKILRIGSRIGLWQKTIINCYSPCSYRNNILLTNEQKGRFILDLLSKKIDAICKKHKIVISRFSFVSEFEQLLNENIQNYGYQKSRLPEITTFYLDIKWNTFEEYLNSLKFTTRKSIRREIRKCRENGVIIEEAKLADLAIKVSELNRNLCLKYNPNWNRFLDPLFFRLLSTHSKEKIKLLIAKKNSEVIGFSLSMHEDSILDVIGVGFDYNMQTKTDFSYFNLGYYVPIRWAIENDVKRIYYRCSMEKIKLDRG